MAYEAFAGVYDAFNEDADYDALFRYVCGVLRAHGVEDGIVADLGCGTGELTLRLAAAGYDMIGVDLSPEMLSVLREKAWETGQEGLLLLCQDIAELDLYGTVRAAVSTFDTFNHIGPAEKFRRALCRVFPGFRQPRFPRRANPQNLEDMVRDRPRPGRRFEQRPGAA